MTQRNYSIDYFLIIKEAWFGHGVTEFRIPGILDNTLSSHNCKLIYTNMRF